MSFIASRLARRIALCVIALSLTTTVAEARARFHEHTRHVHHVSFHGHRHVHHARARRAGFRVALHHARRWVHAHRRLAARRHAWRHAARRHASAWSTARRSGFRHVWRHPRRDRRAAFAASRFRSLAAPVMASPTFNGRGSGGTLLALARRYVGDRNPTGFRGPWCGAFMAMVARRAGIRPPSGFLRASQWAHAGRRVSGPQVGAIAVLRHHVGIVAGVDRSGNPILLSGNHGRRVGVGAYKARRVIAYVEPG